MAEKKYLDSEKVITLLQAETAIEKRKTQKVKTSALSTTVSCTFTDVPDCFALRPAKDKAAVEALRTCAKATDNDLLAADIYQWVGPLSEPPKEE